MDLAQTILSSKPREESGSKTSRKYSFQHNLSLFLLLKRHQQSDDYVYLFDYHDDLMILDSPNNPQSIDFYQIKSKDNGTWSVNNLTKIDKTNSSIIGKLYLNKIKFPDNTRSLNFISNASFGIKLAKEKDSKTKTIINASDIDKANLAICTTAICNEHSISDCDDFKEITVFHVTELSNKDAEAHCLGKLNELIHSLNPNHNIRPILAYNQIMGEVRKKTNTTIGDKSPKDIYELIELKGITKEKFLEFLEKAGLYRSVEEDWKGVENQLIQCGIGALELVKYRKAYRDVEMKLINDVNKIPLESLQAEIQSIIRNGLNTKEISSTSNLGEIINHCTPKISSVLYDEYFIKSLIIKAVLYEDD